MMATEKRLIDADELIKEVRRQATIDPATYPIISATLNAVAELADSLTIMDAVEVVRCKDCKYYLRDDMFGGGYCHGERVKQDDFCSYGERRMSMAKEICQECECVFEPKSSKGMICPACHRKILSESAKARNLNKLGNDARSKQQAEKRAERD